MNEKINLELNIFYQQLKAVVPFYILEFMLKTKTLLFLLTLQGETKNERNHVTNLMKF